MPATITRPVKVPGRILLGPRLVRNGYARIVANNDGSGRIELYDAACGLWCEASGECSFDELWSASPALDIRHLSSLSRASKS